MSSAETNAPGTAPVDDRTTRARIRDAAIACFAEHGVAGTTARKVALAAGVSPGLVIHHFGSMDGLRDACDTYVAAVVREEKHRNIQAGANFDVISSIRNSKIEALGGYVARVLTDDSPAVAKLVDDLVADAEEYMQQGVEAGTLKPADDPRTRAVIFSIWSLGSLVLHRHMERLLGIDPTDLEKSTDSALAAYLSTVYEFLGSGLLSESVATQLKNRAAGIAAGKG